MWTIPFSKAHYSCRPERRKKIITKELEREKGKKEISEGGMESGTEIHAVTWNTLPRFSLDS